MNLGHRRPVTGLDRHASLWAIAAARSTGVAAVEDTGRARHEVGQPRSKRRSSSPTARSSAVCPPVRVSRLRLYESHKPGGRPAPADGSAEYDFRFRAEEKLAVYLGARTSPPATLQKRGGVVRVVVRARIHAVASAPPALCSSSIKASVHTHRGAGGVAFAGVRPSSYPRRRDWRRRRRHASVDSTAGPDRTPCSLRSSSAQRPTSLPWSGTCCARQVRPVLRRSSKAPGWRRGGLAGRRPFPR